MAADKAAEEEKKAEAKAEKKNKIQHVADLEEKIAGENSVDVTPRPVRPRQPKKRLQFTQSYVDVQVTLSNDEGM